MTDENESKPWKRRKATELKWRFKGENQTKTIFAFSKIVQTSHAKIEFLYSLKNKKINAYYFFSTECRIRMTFFFVSVIHSFFFLFFKSDEFHLHIKTFRVTRSLYSSHAVDLTRVFCRKLNFLFYLFFSVMFPCRQFLFAIPS